MRAGRPKIENPKYIRCSIRLDMETEKFLSGYCKDMNISKGEAIRQGIHMVILNRRIHAMNAVEAREKSELGAVNAIESIIEETAEKGLCSVDLSYYSICDAVNDNVLAHFEKEGYKIDGCTISW